MPISCELPVRSIDQAEFAQIDYRVMRLAFECQNQLGRLCDEVIDQNDLAARIEADGLGPVRREVPITVTHGDFEKVYWLYFVVCDASVFELKKDPSFVADHESPVVHYLFFFR